MGIALDLLLSLVFSGTGLLNRVQAFIDTPRDTSRTPGPRLNPVVHRVSIDPDHLSERLGLFVIIVLGESVVQIVDAAGDARYGIALLTTAAASFVLLAGMFGLSVVFGYAGLPHLRAGRIPTRTALGLHCLVTGVIATVAVSLALVVENGAEPLSGPGRWLLCGAVAAYFALGVATGAVSHSADRLRTVSRVITGIVAPLLLGLLAAAVDGLILVICLAVVVLAHLWFERRLPPVAAEAPAA